METIYLLLGSNQGNRVDYLSKARNALGKLGDIQSISGIFQTKPWGNTDQPDFLNQAIALKSGFSPSNLLDRLKEIELSLGRKAVEKWGPRIIDIDIIFYGDQVVKTETLTIPHPKMQERKFVLIPLTEIAPKFIHPVLRKPVSDLLEECPDNLPVEKLN